MGRRTTEIEQSKEERALIERQDLIDNIRNWELLEKGVIYDNVGFLRSVRSSISGWRGRLTQLNWGGTNEDLI